LVLLLGIAGCTQYVQPPSTGSLIGGGAVHRVARGETLWSVAKWYGVDINDLIEANRITDSSRIAVGQKLVIPHGATEPRSDSVRSAPMPERSGPPSAWSGTADQDFVWPVSGRVISVFGMRRGTTLNKGIDIQAPQGTEVWAARGGHVSFVHEGLPGFGKTIILDHGDGFATVYAYVGQILVRKGESVVQHQVIARVGSTGRTEVPALHFEVRRNQKPQNPFHYLP